MPFAEHNNMVKTIPSDRNPYNSRSEIVGTTNYFATVVCPTSMPSLSSSPMQAFEDRLYESRGIREASWISLGRCPPNQVHATRGCAPPEFEDPLKGLVCAFGVHRQQLNAGGEWC
jgi:hypothetical protein